MAIVPTYQRQVGTRAVAGESLRTSASPDDFGAAVGRGLGAVAQGVGQLADARVAIQALDDEAAAKEADNALAADMRDLQYGENGFLTLQGRGAVEARQRHEQAVQEAIRRRGENLTPAQRQAYQLAADARLQSALDRSVVHTANERRSWYTDASTQRLSTFADDALAAYGNPAEVQKNIAAGQAELRSMGALQGWDADALQAREAEFISGVHKNVALRIAMDDPLAADRYVTENRDSLSGEHQFQLDDALQSAVIGARADQNVASILGGAPTERYSGPGDAPYRIPAGRDGTVPLDAVIQATAGLNENTDSAVISDFIRRATGTSIDPRITPWCAAFVNAVLGAQGVEGTGSLAARSFMNFGTATDTPRQGDIVVLERGDDPNAGHVGFFRGYDEDGNILVYGGNQSDGVNVQAYSADRLLGFRTAGSVSAQTTGLPNFSPSGLGAMYEGLMRISDPREREATRVRLEQYMTMRTRAIEAQVDEAVTSLSTMIGQDPTLDLMRLPPQVQSLLGPAKMGELMTYQSRVRDYGQPVTDDAVLLQLQTEYADDPVAFSRRTEAEMFQYRSALSDSDWEKVTGWRQAARTDARKAREEGTNISSAMSLAKGYLEAVGISTAGLTGSARQAMAGREAQFQSALLAEMDGFRAANEGRAPTPTEIQSMVNKLLLPVVVSQPGRLYGTRETEGLLFEAGGVGILPAGRSVSIQVPMAAIPAADRVQIERELETQLGRPPSEEEIEATYSSFITSQYAATQSPTQPAAPAGMRQDATTRDASPYASPAAPATPAIRAPSQMPQPSMRSATGAGLERQPQTPAGFGGAPSRDASPAPLPGRTPRVSAGGSGGIRVPSSDAPPAAQEPPQGSAMSSVLTRARRILGDGSSAWRAISGQISATDNLQGLELRQATTEIIRAVEALPDTPAKRDLLRDLYQMRNSSR